ncbi:MAG: 2-C-methyl-D-erythritol 2,4-cyclodiphosphate synthase [Ignavibacteriales bacterium CG_4_9_14_3_um_filter_34_10]|nr:MAG: 2-C-methyl-D-erythritol 2,4-cyclodiphosphate synthase [Ignavibacteriales bacterium CG_4_9_14_3_um_filter_34_10]
MRIGFGYDVHSLKRGRKLFLGGVEIKSEIGLDGHSDADVLLHAICDALLGSLALGDIGSHFPDTDEKYKNIDSKELLKNVFSILQNNGYKISNIDCTLVLESPKILPYVKQMQKTISDILFLDINRISIKATTSEKLGFIGRKEGAEAFCNALIIKEIAE